MDSQSSESVGRGLPPLPRWTGAGGPHPDWRRSTSGGTPGFHLRPGKTDGRLAMPRAGRPLYFVAAPFSEDVAGPGALRRGPHYRACPPRLGASCPAPDMFVPLYGKASIWEQPPH